MSTIPAGRVFVSTGTDHHRFDRLIQWVDRWLEKQEPGVDCLIQYASSAPPRIARGVQLLARTDLLELYRKADVVVVQGGPGSVFDARSVGHLPIAVPRLSRLREVVDDHQVDFCRQLAREGELILVEDRARLEAELTRALRSPELVRTPPRTSGAPLAAQRLKEQLAELGARRPGTVSLARAAQVARRTRPESWQ